MYAIIPMPAPQYAQGGYMQMETGIEHRVEPPSAKPPRWNIKKPALEVLEKAFERDHFRMTAAHLGSSQSCGHGPIVYASSGSGAAPSFDQPDCMSTR